MKSKTTEIIIKPNYHRKNYFENIAYTLVHDS